MALAALHRTHTGSRASTCSLNCRWPVVAYGLPCGLRTLSASARHVGHLPAPACSWGHPGVEHTRGAMPCASWCAGGVSPAWCARVVCTPCAAPLCAPGYCPGMCGALRVGRVSSQGAGPLGPSGLAAAPAWSGVGGCPPYVLVGPPVSDAPYASSVRPNVISWNTPRRASRMMRRVSLRARLHR